MNFITNLIKAYLKSIVEEIIRDLYYEGPKKDSYGNETNSNILYRAISGITKKVLTEDLDNAKEYLEEYKEASIARVASGAILNRIDHQVATVTRNIIDSMGREALIAKDAKDAVEEVITNTKSAEDTLPIHPAVEKHEREKKRADRKRPGKNQRKYKREPQQNHMPEDTGPM